MSKKVQIEYAGFNSRLFSSFIDMTIICFIVHMLVTLILPAVMGLDQATYDEFDYLRIQLQTGVISQQDFMDGAKELGIITYFYVFVAVYIIAILAATFFMWVYMDGATVGKKLIYCKIIDAKTGKTPTITQLIKRILGYLLTSFIAMIGLVLIGLSISIFGNLIKLGAFEPKLLAGGILLGAFGYLVIYGALGAGFLSLKSSEKMLTLHDRIAGTVVIKKNVKKNPMEMLKSLFKS